MQLSVKKPRQATLELLRAGDNSSRRVQHSLQLVCRRFRRIRQDSITLFHDLLLHSYLYHCVWSVITAHSLTPEKRDNN